ncbi:hypothetical protein J6590_073190 [Homalodisca vitripennis]|nr:hypothetical protein J6590_073190 [Homalodisca vitripennis]
MQHIVNIAFLWESDSPIMPCSAGLPRGLLILEPQGSVLFSAVRGICPAPILQTQLRLVPTLTSWWKTSTP